MRQGFALLCKMTNGESTLFKYKLKSAGLSACAFTLSTWMSETGRNFLFYTVSTPGKPRLQRDCLKTTHTHTQPTREVPYKRLGGMKKSRRHV